MALVSSKTSHITMGNVIARTFDLTFTGVTSAEVKTGLGQIHFATYASTLDDAYDIYANYSDAGTTRKVGSVFINNVGAGATGKLFVIGAA